MEAEHPRTCRIPLREMTLVKKQSICNFEHREPVHLSYEFPFASCQRGGPCGILAAKAAATQRFPIFMNRMSRVAVLASMVWKSAAGGRAGACHGSFRMSRSHLLLPASSWLRASHRSPQSICRLAVLSSSLGSMAGTGGTWKLSLCRQVCGCRACRTPPAAPRRTAKLPGWRRHTAAMAFGSYSVVVIRVRAPMICPHGQARIRWRRHFARRFEHLHQPGGTDPTDVSFTRLERCHA